MKTNLREKFTCDPVSWISQLANSPCKEKNVNPVAHIWCVLNCIKVEEWHRSLWCKDPLHDLWRRNTLLVFSSAGAHIAVLSHDGVSALLGLCTWWVGLWNSGTGGHARVQTTRANISFLFVMGVFSSLCDRFQSERESGDRNFAIGYYLKEKKVWSWISHAALLTLLSVVPDNAFVLASAVILEKESWGGIPNQLSFAKLVFAHISVLCSAI